MKITKIWILAMMVMIVMSPIHAVDSATSPPSADSEKILTFRDTNPWTYDVVREFKFDGNRYVVKDSSGDWVNPSKISSSTPSETSFLNGLKAANSMPTPSDRFKDGTKQIAGLVNEKGTTDVNDDIQITYDGGYWGDGISNYRIQSAAEVQEKLNQPSDFNKDYTTNTDSSINTLIYNSDYTITGRPGIMYTSPEISAYEVPFRFNPTTNYYEVQTESGVWVKPNDMIARDDNEQALLTTLTNANKETTSTGRFEAGTVGIQKLINGDEYGVRNDVFIEDADGTNLWGDTSGLNERIDNVDIIAAQLSKPTSSADTSSAVIPSTPSSGNQVQITSEVSISEDILKKDIAIRQKAQELITTDKSIQEKEKELAILKEAESKESDPSKKITALENVNKLETEIKELNKQKTELTNILTSGSSQASSAYPQAVYDPSTGMVKYKDDSNWVVTKIDGEKYLITNLNTGAMQTVEKNAIAGLPTTITDKGHGSDSIQTTSANVYIFSKGGSSSSGGGSGGPTPPTDYSADTYYYIKNQINGQIMVAVPSSDDMNTAFKGNDQMTAIKINPNLPKDYLQTKLKNGDSLTTDDKGNLIFTQRSTENGNIVKETLYKDSTYEKSIQSTKKGSDILTERIKPDGTLESISNKYGTMFYSKSWALNKDGMLTYGGNEVSGYAKNKALFKDGGYVREVQTESAPVIVKQDASGRTTITQENRKTVTLNADDSKRIMPEDSSIDIDDDYIKNLGTMLAAAENNRFERSDLITPDGRQLVAKSAKLMSSGKEATITTSGNDVVYTEKSGGATKTVTYSTYGKGNAYVSKSEYMDKNGNVKSITYKVDKDKGTLDTLVIGDKSYKYTPRGDISMYCNGDTCFNIDNGKAYQLDGDKVKECPSGECTELEGLDKALEARRTGMGGPNNRERRANQVFNILESSQTGMGKLFSLFLGDEKLNKWRNDVDEWFCSTVILGGKDCWTSQVCGEYADKTYPGTLVMETPNGMLDISAHVEGERQDLLFEINGKYQKEYLYKLSYAVRNPKDADDKIRFNVRLIGEKTLMLYNKYNEVKEGDIFSRAGKTVLVQYSNTRYDRICIVFEDEVQKKRGETVKELCNDIIPVAGNSMSEDRLFENINGEVQI